MKKINLARIIQRLTNRFDLTEFQAEPFLLSETVIPTTDVDALLIAPTVALASGIDSTSTGWKTAHTVPAGKRWRVVVVDANRTAGSSALATNIGVTNAAGSIVVPVYSASAASSLTAGVLNQQVIIPEGWMVQLNISTAEAASTWQLKILYYEEDAF